MPRVPQSKNNATPLQQFTDTAYDNVVICAENIDAIIAAAEATDVMVLYLGAYPTNPTEGKDGAPLVSGNFYLNTTSSSLVYYDAENDTWVESDVDTVVTAARDAEAARDAAQAAQASAEASASNASTSAGEAASSASAAATSESNAATSESNASVSESNAATSANNAANSETAASGHASAAALSEGNAANSETAAEASEINAAASAVTAANAASQAEAAFDNFDDMYLGRKTTPPTTDNDGQPLQVGASYWHDFGDNTGEQRFWNGASWESPELTATQAAQQAVAARDDAEIAEGNAELYKNAAQASANAAGVDANNAGNSATAAATSESNAAASASAANDSESAARASETNAATSASDASDSAAAAAVSEANAAASASVFEWQRFVRDEADLNTMREQNKDARVASGFDHYGQHVNDGSWDAVNEGIWTVGNNLSGVYAPNTINMGVKAGTASGESETNFPVTCIAGLVSTLLFNRYNPDEGGSGDTWDCIKFPEAPDGTIIYDANGDVRGTGNANRNLTTEIDPKYGDVAGDVNEAVARAFEGSVRNGDFRNANTGEWVATRSATLNGFGTGTLAVTAGGGTAGGAASQLIASSATIGEEITVSARVDGIDNTQLARISVNSAADLGSGTYSLDASVGDGDEGYYTWTFTAQTTTLYLHLAAQSASNGTTVYYKNASFHRTSEEVVIDRHDVFGGEYFLEEVSATNPYVYPKGMIQSKATSMNGITTVATNRPSTYYAVFAGDTSSNGLGVDFWAATIQQKIDMVSDPSNNLFLLKDGRLVQWRMRQITIASNKNGDWYRIGSNNVWGQVLSTFPNSHSYVSPQGMKDSAPTWYDTDAGSTSVWYPHTHTSGSSEEVGVYQAGISDATNDETVGIYGQCYFHLWGVVRRLNQGAYHPSFNSLGTAFVDTGQRWYTTPDPLTSTSKCFTRAHDSGYIDSVFSSRDDGRYYDAIYAGGDGGVNDYRLASWDMSSKEEAAKVFQKVVNGTYRGEERITHTHVNTSTESGTATGAVLERQLPPNLEDGGTIVIVASDGSTIDVRRITSIDYALNAVNWDIAVIRPSGGYYMVSAHTHSSVSGKFQMVDVIGDPANILATPDLVNGWQGGWIPAIPDGTSTYFKNTRKALERGTFTYTQNNGDSWTVWGDWDTWWSDTANGHTYSHASTLVSVIEYPVFAKQTVEADNEPVLNVYEGLGEVRTFAHRFTTQGSLLAESMMGKVITNSNSGNLRGNCSLDEVLIHETSHSLDVGSAYAPKHSPISLTAPNNDSPAVKALWYQTANNQQVSLNFAWNELVWSQLDTSKAIAAGTQFTVTPGDVVRMSGFANGQIEDNYFKFNQSYTNATWTAQDFNAYSVDRKGKLTYLPTLLEITGYHIAQGAVDAWGDDSTVRITDGTSTYINLNGETCLRGTATLSKPIGYTKNQARVGTQTKGVDY